MPFLRPAPVTSPPEGNGAWLFPLALVFHNLEEGLFLPAWSQHAGRFHPPVQPGPYWVALALSTAVSVGLTARAQKKGGGWLTACAGAWVATLGNVLFPHLIATLAMREYAPGLATALAFNVPADVYLLSRAFRERRLRALSVVIASVLAGVATLAAFALWLWAVRALH